MAVGETAISISEHHAVGNRVEPRARAELRYAIARRRAKRGEGRCRHTGLQSKGGVGRGGEVYVVSSHLVNQRATLGE